MEGAYDHDWAIMTFILILTTCCSEKQGRNWKKQIIMPANDEYRYIILPNWRIIGHFSNSGHGIPQMKEQGALTWRWLWWNKKAKICITYSLCYGTILQVVKIDVPKFDTCHVCVWGMRGICIYKSEIEARKNEDVDSNHIHSVWRLLVLPG